MQRDDGVQKGIKTILTERGVWKEGMKLECNHCKDVANIGRVNSNPECCARGLLASHEDFQQHKIWIEETAEERGHLTFFVPKFHCELNYIEMIWAYVKQALRRSCYSFTDLQVTLPECLSNLPLAFVKRASRHCFRFMSVYRAGLPAGPLADYPMKRYSGHRRIPANVTDSITSDFEKMMRETKNKI